MALSIITFWERSKKEDVHEVWQEFRRANLGKRLIVVLENFSSHHAILVKDYAANNNTTSCISRHTQQISTLSSRHSEQSNERSQRRSS
jgi:hypothetical protein